MYSMLVCSEDFVRDVMDERLREAERERLAAQASGPGRPVRVRVAGWLHALAWRIEGQPRSAAVGA
ncbi:MAG TPA: hypothetical protein VGK33_17720, partial [Chloroflexota bacterium]